MHTNLFDFFLIVWFVLSMSCGAPSTQRSMTSLKMQQKTNKTTRTVDLALLGNCATFLVMVSVYLKYWHLWTTALIRPLQTTLSIATLSKKRKETIETKNEKCKNFLNSEPVSLHHWHVLMDWSMRCSYRQDYLLLTYHILHRNFELLCFSSISWGHNPKRWGQIQQYIEASSLLELWSQLFLQHFSEKCLFMLFLL